MKTLYYCLTITLSMLSLDLVACNEDLSKAVVVMVDEESDKVEPLVKVDPKHPEGAPQRGHVSLMLVINEKGDFDSVEVLYASDALFEKEVLKVLPSWRYPPSQKKNLVLETIYFGR